MIPIQGYYYVLYTKSVNTKSHISLDVKFIRVN